MLMLFVNAATTALTHQFMVFIVFVNYSYNCYCVYKLLLHYCV